MFNGSPNRPLGSLKKFRFQKEIISFLYINQDFLTCSVFSRERFIKGFEKVSGLEALVVFFYPHVHSFIY